MRARVGDETHPSVALLDCHVRELDQELNRSYLASTSNLERRELALAGLANLFLWLGWLRSSECWDLTWEDLMVIEPADSATVDLPTGCGMVSGRLAPETKSARSHRPDVPMAYKSLSGFHLGKWFHRARAASGLGANWHLSTARVFTQTDGTPWTSKFFRGRFLYPSLHCTMKTGPGGPGVRIVHTRCAVCTHTGLFGTLERVSLNFCEAPPPDVHHTRTSAARIFFLASK